MARVLVLGADLLFGSRVQGDLTAAGHEVSLVPDAGSLSAGLADTGSSPVAVVVVDLTDAALDGTAVIAGAIASGELAHTATLGFYSHVEPAVRERAEQVGFDLVVPRSRMAREGAALLAGLIVAADRSQP